MQLKLFKTLRHSRSATIAWIITAMMLPLLLTLLPAPATAAEQSAYAELQSALCDPTGKQGNEALPGAHHKEACLICATGCNAAEPAAVALPAFDLAFVLQRPMLAAAGPPVVQSSIGPAVLIRLTPPRGPPVSNI